MCCSMRQPHSHRVSEDTPPQCLLPSRTGGPRGERATGHVRATGRRTAPSGSPLPRRRMITQTSPVLLRRSQHLQLLHTAAVSGRDELPPMPQFIWTGHTETTGSHSPSTECTKAHFTYCADGIGSSAHQPGGTAALSNACDAHCQLPCSLGKCWPATDTYVQLHKWDS